jgi:hypothetical protein
MGLAVGFVIGKEVYERPSIEKVPASQSTSNPGDAGNAEKK